MKKVSIIGCGYIGIPTATTFAMAGYEVRGVDINEELVQSLSQGRLHFVEPGLSEELKKAIALGRLSFSGQVPQSDVFIIAVQTPYVETPEGKRVSELRHVISAAESIGRVIKPGDLVVLESTSPPRTTELVERTVAETSGLDSSQFMTAHCPERIIPGKMLRELRENDRVIGARRREAAEYAKSIYEPILESGTIRLTDDITAEMCKLTENTYRDINIAYANELSKVCDSLSIDVYQLIELANCHPRVNVHQPGVGVGGHCIAVDPWFIHEGFEEETPLILTARLVNDGKPKWVAAKAAKGLKKGAKIAVLGMAFKEDIDDCRESPSVVLCAELEALGMEVLACEPNVEGEVAGYKNHSLDEALAACELAVISRKHRQFIKEKAKIAEKPYYDCVGLMR